MKKTISIIIVLIVLFLLVLLISFKISGFASAESTYNYSYSWTKAICNETHCQDYQIYCNNSQMINQIQITGAIITLPKGWVDPRNETMRERICEFN
jgi:hypothetical protein